MVVAIADHHYVIYSMRIQRPRLHGGGAIGRKSRIAASESKKRGTLGPERPEAGENKNSPHPVGGGGNID